MSEKTIGEIVSEVVDGLRAERDAALAHSSLLTTEIARLERQLIEEQDRSDGFEQWLHRYDGDLMFGQIAAINGQGPCERCVGHSVSGPVTETAGRAFQEATSDASLTT